MRAEPVIGKVRQAVADEGGQGIASSELAQQYAELCAQANKRLANCANCLKQGMISEALRVADAEPQLLDLCAALDFIGVEKWEKLCQDRKWTAAERLDAKAIQDINDAFCSSQIVEPMLKEYRRAVRANETRECIRLLRRLASVDKNNANWTEDLKGFERKRWGELRKEFEQANKAENIDALASLLIEINGEWNAPKDMQLRDEVRDACRLVYAKQAFAKGQEIVRSISGAYAALNYEQVGESLGAFERLLSDGHLTPDAPMQAQVDEAKEWYLIEKKRREDERLYEETLSRLREAVENGNPSELEDILNVLSRFERPIPDRLEERAKTLIEGYQLAQERRRKRILFSGIAVSLLLMAGILSYLAKIRFDKEVVSISTKLEQCFSAEEVSVFETTIARAEKDQPKVFQNAEVQKLVRRTGELKAIVEKKHAAFEAAMSRLDAIRESGFAQDAGSVEGMLTEARSNAKPGVEQGRLAVFVREWEARKLELQAKVDEKALEAIAVLEQQFEKLVQAGSNDRTAATSSLNDLKTRFSETTSSLGQVSDAVTARVSALAGRLEGYGREIEGKEKQIALIRKARSLREYLEGIETYARAFPEDKLTKTLGRVIDEAALYRQIEEIPTACGPSNVFWASEIKARSDRTAKAVEQWPAVKDQLMSLEQEKRYSDLWECNTEWGTIFVEGKPTSSFSQGMRQFEGMVYKPKPDDIQPEFKVETFKESAIYDKKLMAHCDFVKGLISMARFSTAERTGDDLMGKMSALSTNDEIPPLLKLRLMDMLAGHVQSLVGENGMNGWGEMRAELQSIPSDLHWLCKLHRDVVLGNEKAKQILQKWFKGRSITDQNRFVAEVRENALQRGIRWVGAVDLVDRTQCRWVGEKKPREVWVVRRINGLPKTFIAETEIQGEVKTYGAFLPGEPLFAPIDERTTLEIVQTLKKKYRIQNAKALDWPASWPDNFRN